MFMTRKAPEPEPVQCHFYDDSAALVLPVSAADQQTLQHRPSGLARGGLGAAGPGRHFQEGGTSLTKN